MALGLLGGAARAVGGQMVKSGGKAMAKKVMSRGDKKQNKSINEGSAQQDGGRSGALTVKPKTTLIPASVLKAPDTKTTSIGSDGTLVTIYKKVVQIDKILKGTLAEEKALTKEKKKQDKREDRDRREGKLEKKKTKEEKKQKGLSLPKLSFFDRIKQFITSIILGIVLKNLVGNKDFLNNLKSIFDAIVKGIDVTADLILGVIDGLGTFLLWGQKVIDGSKDWLKNNRGDEAVGRLNQLLGSLGNLFNATIIVGALAAKLGGKPKTKPGQKPGGRLGPRVKPTKPLIRKLGSALGPRGNARKMQLKHGHAARGIYQNSYDNAISKGRTPKQAAETANAAVKKALKKGQIISRPQTGSLGGTDKGSSLMKGGFKKAPGRLGLKLFGKQGVKLVSKTFGKIPVMGPLIVAVASLLAGEPIGQAVFKGLGAALGGLLGSFIPIPVIGTILGETIGVLVGDMMYSLIMGGGAKEAGAKFMTALKTALDVGGLIVNFFKEGFGRFFNDFPTVDVPGVMQSPMGALFPFLATKGETGFFGEKQVKEMPNLSILFNPLAMLTELIPHAAASFLPAIFGKGGTAFGESKKVPDNKPEKSKSIGSTGSTASTGEASNLAGEAGKFIESKLSSPKDYQAITEHPDFGGVRGSHATNSYHYSGRAIDIGAWDYEQGPIVDVINQFNKIKNVSPAEIITAKQDPTYHGDHVHLAYSKGGFTKSGAHKITVGENGREFVLDADSTAAIEKVFPGLLSATNKAKGEAAINALKNYASYEAGGESTVVINQNQIPASMMQQKQSSSAPIIIPVGVEDPFASAYANC